MRKIMIGPLVLLLLACGRPNNASVVTDPTAHTLELTIVAAYPAYLASPTLSSSDASAYPGTGSLGPTMPAAPIFTSSPPSFVPPGTPVPIPSQGPGATPLEIAQSLLAVMLGVDRDMISVVSNEEVAWSDSSLGCPKPDVNYMQVITPGYKIILEANGQRYEYHTDTGHTVVLCNQQ